MTNKILFGILILSIISLAFFVAADNSYAERNGEYTFEIQMVEGWNLMPGTIPSEGIFPESEIQPDDISVVWYYSPYQKKYLQVHPETDWDALNDDDEDFVLTTSMWFYSEKAGKIKYSTLEDYPPLESRQLIKGWNFVTMTPDMFKGNYNPSDARTSDSEYFSFDEINGDCDINKVFFWMYSEQEWNEFSSFKTSNLDEEDFADLIGNAFAVNVASDCTLATPKSTGGSPPALPGQATATIDVPASLRQEIKMHYYEEYFQEECELNDAQNYLSIESCNSAMKCLGEEFSELIPKTDLQELVNYMRDNGGEDGVIWYFDEVNPSLYGLWEEVASSCLDGRHKDY